MPVSGGIKFFKMNRGDVNFEGASAAVSSGSTTRANARSRKRWLRWESEGSDDVTTETYDLIFDGAYDIDRIILNRHNLEDFTVQYWNGAAWTHFSGVVTAEGTQTNITETGNTKTTNYYEVASVNTTKIRVSCDVAQTTDAEKYIYEVIATEEIGTLTGYPGYNGTFMKRRAKKESLTGRMSQSILGESFKCSLGFKVYPTEADHLIMQTLWELNEGFLVYPCGAKASQFRYTTMTGNRLQDLFLVAIDGDFAPGYNRNVYVTGLNYSLSMTEVT